MSASGSTGPTGDRVQLRAGGATDTGRQRSNNQDNYVLLPDRGLWVVADGMGGAQGGEVASKLAVDTFTATYREASTTALVEAFAEANRRIHEASESPELRGMGTTSVAIALVPEEPDPDLDEPEGEPPQHLLVVNVGDSRGYLFRDGGLLQLTEDHSVVAELVRDGRISAEEAEAHPQRNIITRVLGVYPEVQIDLWPVDAVRGDRFLLCSDGLFNEVGDNQIAAVLRRLDDPSEAADELVRLANESGGRDNITVIVLDVVDDGGVAEAASTALAGEPSTTGGDDLAGFSTALADPRDGLSDEQLDALRADPPADADVTAGVKPSRAERRAARKASRTSRSRLTWRVVLFTVLLLAVVGGAIATIQWYGTSTYFVGFDGEEVAIYQGRPGGLLWIEPRLVDDTGILRDEVPARFLPALDAGHQQSSLAQAERYVSNIERDIAAIVDRETAATSTTTSTTAATTTTAAP